MTDFTLPTLFSLAIGFLGIGIMVLVHEMGHLLAARIFKIEVETVQFGFGPAIKKWKSRKYDTNWQIGLIPFGGFCRMRGQDDLNDAINRGLDDIEKSTEKSLYNVSPVKRIFTYLAGPLANIVFAIVCYSLLLALPTITQETEPRIVVQSDYSTLYSETVTASKDAGLKTGDYIVSVNDVQTPYYSILQKTLSEHKKDPFVVFKTKEGKVINVKPTNGKFGILPFYECKINQVKKDSPEYRAGLRSNDLITHVNGKEVTNIFDLFLESKNSNNLVLTVLNQEGTKTVSFVCINSSFNFSVQNISSKTKGENFPKALIKSFSQCFESFYFNLKSVFEILSGKDKAKETVSGTFGASMNMGIMTTRSFRTSFNSGLRMILFLMSSVSISLAVANLLPVTAFDGGLILISAAELIVGHSFSPRFYLVLQTLGLVTVVLIFVLMRVF